MLKLPNYARGISIQRRAVSRSSSSAVCRCERAPSARNYLKRWNPRPFAFVPSHTPLLTMTSGELSCKLNLSLLVDTSSSTSDGDTPESYLNDMKVIFLGCHRWKGAKIIHNKEFLWSLTTSTTTYIKIKRLGTFGLKTEEKKWTSKLGRRDVQLMATGSALNGCV